MAVNAEPVALEGFPVGIVTRSRETDVPAEGLSVAENVDILDGGNIALRPGYSTVAGGSAGHSGWDHPSIPFGLYVSSAGNLTMVSADGTISTVASVSASRKMSYCALNGDVYYSNGNDMGIVTSTGSTKLWGVDPPPSPIVSATSGALSEAQYQLAYTVTFNDLEESAPSLISAINLSDNQGLSIGPIPDSPDITSVRLYTSSLCGGDGEELNFLTSLTPGAASYTITGSSETHYRLNTLNKIRMVCGSKIATFRRWILAAIGDQLWFSEESQASLTDYRHNWWAFDDDNITFIGPVEDGVFIGTESKLWFLVGTNPREWNRRVVREVGVIDMVNTPRVPDDLFYAEGSQGQITAFMTTEAQLCIGRNGGVVQNISGDRIAINNHKNCEINYYETAGRRQLIVALHDSKGTSRWLSPATSP